MGKKQQFIGIILKSAKKGMCGKLYFTVDRVFMHVYNFLDFGGSVTNSFFF